MLHYWILLAFFRIIICDDKNWWKSTEIYEIFIMSFKDSDGDGVGDINGITSKLDHFSDLQIGSIWITPFYESPLDDMGYDISNYTAINPLFGTMEDFENLIKEATKKGIKIIVDFVVNHSSDEHVWFKKSVDRIKPYDEFYMWQDPKGYDSNGRPRPPNNWVSRFGGSAWEWNDKRKQFYYHAFSKKQVDLNLRNEKVKEEIKNLVKFWFDKGVSGLRLDAVESYTEDPHLRDEPLLNPNIEKNEHGWLEFDHVYTRDFPENFEFIHELRLFTNQINKIRGDDERILMAESYASTIEVLMKYYGSEKYPVAHYPFNFMFVVANEYYTSNELHGNITEWFENMPAHGVANWVAENHDRYRIGGRFALEYRHVINFLLMLLPGVACFYYGQEIGMINSPVRPDQRRDPYLDSNTALLRDFSRTPMQWDDSMNAGFTTKRKPWLPVNPNYWSENVETQKQNNNSFYRTFKELLSLRKSKTCKYGAFNSYVLSEWMYAFTRFLKGSQTIVVVINLGTELENVNLTGEIPNLGDTLIVQVASDNAGYKIGDMVIADSKNDHDFSMRPMSVIVLVSKMPISQGKNDLE